MPEVKPSGPTRDDIDQFLGPRGENVELGTADKANVFEKAADLVPEITLDPGQQRLARAGVVGRIVAFTLIDLHFEYRWRASMEITGRPSWLSSVHLDKMAIKWLYLEHGHP